MDRLIFWAQVCTTVSLQIFIYCLTSHLNSWLPIWIINFSISCYYFPFTYCNTHQHIIGYISYTFDGKYGIPSFDNIDNAHVIQIHKYIIQAKYSLLMSCALTFRNCHSFAVRNQNSTYKRSFNKPQLNIKTHSLRCLRYTIGYFFGKKNVSTFW